MKNGGHFWFKLDQKIIFPRVEAPQCQNDSLLVTPHFVLYWQVMPDTDEQEHVFEIC